MDWNETPNMRKLLLFFALFKTGEVKKRTRRWNKIDQSWEAREPGGAG